MWTPWFSLEKSLESGFGRGKKRGKASNETLNPFNPSKTPILLSFVSFILTVKIQVFSSSFSFSGKIISSYLMRYCCFIYFMDGNFIIIFSTKISLFRVCSFLFTEFPGVSWVLMCQQVLLSPQLEEFLLNPSLTTLWLIVNDIYDLGDKTSMVFFNCQNHFHIFGHIILSIL